MEFEICLDPLKMKSGLQALGCCSLTNAQAIHRDDQRPNLYFVLREGPAHFWLWWLLRLGPEKNQNGVEDEQSSRP
jgi:hypothetical protein